jgi:hypothetical protein
MLSSHYSFTRPAELWSLILMMFASTIQRFCAAPWLQAGPQPPLTRYARGRESPADPGRDHPWMKPKAPGDSIAQRTNDTVAVASNDIKRCKKVFEEERCFTPAADNQMKNARLDTQRWSSGMIDLPAGGGGKMPMNSMPA